MFWPSCISWIALAACVTATAPASAGSYSFTELVGPGIATRPTGINGDGQVVGSVSVLLPSGGYKDVGFVWNNGVFRTMSYDGAGAHPLSTHLLAINAAGAVVGSVDPKHDFFGFAVVGPAGSDSLRKPLRRPTNEPYSILVDVNNHNQAVGIAYTDQYHSDVAIFVVGKNETRVLPAGAEMSDFHSINNAGVALGTYYGVSVGHGSFIYNGGVITTIPFPSVDENGRSFYYGDGATISESGVIAGTAGYGSVYGVLARAFKYQNGSFRFYGFPGSWSTFGLAANGKGLFGTYTLRPQIGSPTHIFVKADSGTFTLDEYHTIDPPGAASAMISSVNSNGDFVGTYLDSAENVHGFLATCAIDQQPCTQ